MTRNKFNEELKQLLNSVRVMGVNLEDTLDKVIANLEQKDAVLAQQIISDDDNFDNSEVNIEKQCLELVLTQTPVATDWREIASCLKLVGDMERIADHCSDISQYTLKLIERILCRCRITLWLCCRLCARWCTTASAPSAKMIWSWPTRLLLPMMR